MAAHVPRRFRRPLRRYARKYHIPARVLAAQIQTESNFNENAVSSANARGATQFIPSTARQYGVHPGKGKRRLASQIRGQAHYLADLGGGHDIAGALAKYAGGPGNPQASYARLVLQRARGYKGIGKGPDGTSASGRRRGGTRLKVKTTPGVNRAADRKQLAAQYLLEHDTTPTGTPKKPDTRPASLDPLLKLVTGLNDARDTSPKTTASLVRTRGQAPAKSQGDPHGSKHAKGVAHFEGKPVAAWIKPWLVYARRHGWKGTVQSGFRSYADQVRIYNSGVRPAAKPGTSNHEGADFPRGAVDVDRASAPQLARILARAGSPLKFAGAKDPVHFSHPHNGSY